MTDDPVSTSRAIQRKTGNTFHLATLAFPKRMRHETYVLYAFFRKADEIVDTTTPQPPAEQREQLESLRQGALGEQPTDDEVVQAFANTREEHNIDPADVTAFIEAMKRDIDKDRYATYDEVANYMDGSASAVGRMMTAIMETEAEDAALPHATSLGQAFQLSNFLRDVGEDIDELGRIYLPQETLAEYGVDEADITNHNVTDAFRQAMEHEMQRAEDLYRHGVDGIKYLPDGCQLPVLIAAVLYAEHHRLIREQQYDVLTQTPSLSFKRKAWLTARTTLSFKRHGEPRTAFDRVATIP